MSDQKAYSSILYSGMLRRVWTSLAARALVVAFGMLFIGAASHAQSISFVQEKQCESTGTSTTCAFSSPVTAGDALAIMVAPLNTSSAAYTIGVSDNLNGAWTQNGNTCFSPYNAQAETFYYLDSKGGSVTVTITSSTSTAIYATVLEGSGIATSGAVDVPATCTYVDATTVTTPNVTTTNPNDAILASPAVAGNDGTITVSSPYTVFGAANSGEIPVAGRIVASAGTYTGATFTTQYSNPGFGIIATYKALTPVAVSVSPTAATLYEGQTQQFTATVVNTTNTAVNWSISPSGTGTITNAGLYTPPVKSSVQQTVSITATSQADTSKSASATVTLMPSVLLTWATPAAINAGTALSATQLDATASVPGTFSYVPAAGTVPAPGTDALSVTFTPTDTTDYQTAYDYVLQAVNGPAPIITTAAGNGSYGYAGDGGPAIDAEFFGPTAIVFDSAGNYYIVDGYNHVVRKVNIATGIITTVAGNGGYGSNGDGGPATSAEIGVSGIAFDSTGDLYISDGYSNTIRKVDASTGIITTIAGTGTAGYNGDGLAALSTELNGPGGLLLDASGNLYFSDSKNERVRKISASTGLISTVAGNGTKGFTGGDGGPAISAELDNPGSLAFDSAGNLYLSDSYNSRVLKVNLSTGAMTTIAGGGPRSYNYVGDGGPATSATIDWTAGIAFDSAGNLYIGDNNGGRVRKVNLSTGIITTVAGDGVVGYSGDEGPATSAEMGLVAGIAFDPHGNLYIADNGVVGDHDYRIREVNFNTVVNWPAPAPITDGTALSSVQLNAAANVPGTFAYSPAAGTVLSVGQHTLSVTFTPTDTTDYQPVTQTVTIDVSSVTVADSGTIRLTVNGVTAATTTYGLGSTPSSIAAGLASTVTSSSPVSVTAVGDELDLEAKTAGSATNYSYRLQTTSFDSTNFTQPSFMNPAATGALEGGADQNTTGATIYSYSIPSSGGYDANGNLLTYNDSVMGAWSFSYDNLNRLMSAVATPAVDSDNYFCWSYDNWGNRLQQMGSNQSITGGGGSTCTQQSGSNVNLAWANYSTANNNRMTTTVQAPGGVTYDGAGNVTNDGHVSYLYNADGQICAIQTTYNSMTVMFGYIYDADGDRVAKGTITSMSCDPSANGFVATANYVLDQSGHQLSRFAPDSNGNIALDYTNVYAAGTLIGTYDGSNLHLYLNDWLGTRRVQTDYSGVVEQDCQSLPYGDSETCAPTPAENLYTGKARDAETAGGVSPFGVNQGNDYFGARYYSSVMGRWLSPDWSEKPQPVAYADFKNPQSLNLYQYEGNNPVARVDKDGHCWPLCTALIGAAAGALAEGLSEVANGEKLNYYKIGAAAAGGALMGAITGPVGDAAEIGILGKATAQVVGSVAGGALERKLDGGTVFSKSGAKAAAVDAVAGATSAKVEEAAGKFAATKLARKIIPVVTNTAIDAARRSVTPPERLKRTGNCSSQNACN